jgi:hypothetical protein
MKPRKQLDLFGNLVIIGALNLKAECMSVQKSRRMKHIAKRVRRTVIQLGTFTLPRNDEQAKEKL